MAENDPFAFLENVLTPDTLRALRAARANNNRLAAQSMTTNERAGFGVGTLAFEGLSRLFPNSRARRESRKAEANQQALTQASEDVKGQTFEGPTSGLEENVAMLRAMSQRFAEAGDKQAALQAQLGAAQMQTQLEEARLRTKQQNLNIEAMEGNIELSDLRREGERRNLFLNRHMWKVNESDGDLTLGDALDVSTPSGRMKYAGDVEAGDLYINQEQAYNLFKDQFDSSARAILGSDVSKMRENLQGANSLYDTANRFATILTDAPIDPTTDVATATGFINRLQQDFQAGKAVKAQISKDNFSSSEYGLANAYEDSQTLAGNAIRQYARDRALSASQVTEMAYTMALIFNGTRPTDRDFENAVLLLNGNARDRAIVLSSIYDSVDRVAGRSVKYIDDFVSGASNDPGVKTLAPLRRRVTATQATFESTYKAAQEKFPVPTLPTSPNALPEDNPFSNAGFE